MLRTFGSEAPFFSRSSRVKVLKQQAAPEMLTRSKVVPPASGTTRYPQYVRDGFRPMLPGHEQFLDDHGGAEPLVVEDRSLGTICCARVPGAGPVVAMQRSRGPGGELSSIWAFPKGHPNAGESDADGAVRETLEEMGIDVKTYLKKDFRVRMAYSFAGLMHTDAWMRHRDFGAEAKRPVCVFHKEVVFFLAVLPKPLPLTPQEEEVAEAAWIPLSHIKDVTYPDMWKQLERFFASPDVRALLQLDGPSAPPASRRGVIKKTVAKRAVTKKSSSAASK